MWAAIHILAATWGLNRPIAALVLGRVRVSFDKARDATVLYEYSRRPGAKPNYSSFCSTPLSSLLIIFFSR